MIRGPSPRYGATHEVFHKNARTAAPALACVHYAPDDYSQRPLSTVARASVPANILANGLFTITLYQW